MKQTFLTKVSYTKQFDNGTFKRVVEQYLFDGHTFTDCEANVYTHLGSMIKGEFTIMKMDKFMVDEIFGSGEKFFLVKQVYTDIDGREIKMKLLVIDNMIEGAKTRVALFNDEINYTTLPEIKSIVETKILDYFQSAIETIEE
ncbi:MAG: hypothetical protein RL078_1195 [Bacteroidota bacterium]|jgi:hypothetical protein